MAMHGVRFCPATLELTRLVREKSIDIIHTHLTAAAYHGFFTGQLARLPVVSSMHVLSRDFVYRWLLPRPENRIITVSEFVRQGLIERGVSASRVQTIYNGTNFCSPGSAYPTSEEERLPVRAELSLPPDAELVGIFGHVGEFKGHFLLAEAVADVVRACPRAFIVCVGSLEADIQRQLWEIASRNGMAERLRFTGVRDDVRRLLSAMDVITLPSRYEACSMAIIEAMAMGKPVVATRAGGNPELVQHGETGLLIERNVPELTEALTSLLTDRELRLRMGEAGRLRAEAHFSAEVMAARVESLYGELVPRKVA
jgi:glycosyltransferase involved in cell wall biosynthesis